MAKRKRGFTQKKYDKWLKEGRGQGSFGDYKPWLTIQDVPSMGLEIRLHGTKVKRQYELFSKLEKAYYMLLEFSDIVIDIQEQFPLLYREETIAIADKLGIKHPTDPSTDENIVMSTDFLITIKENDNLVKLARTVKPSEKLDDRRVIEKFEIERQYWNQKEIDWGIVTEKEIDKIIADNIEQIRLFNYLDDKLGFEHLNRDQIISLVNEFKYDLVGNGIVVRSIADSFDKKMHLMKGTSIALFKHLLFTKQIEIDLKTKLSIDTPQDIDLSSKSLIQEVSLL